jgi:hypothetical protein
VYNLEVETEHCYYVSARGVLSHNANPCGVPDGFPGWNRIVRQERIATGTRIHKIDKLVEYFGGTKGGWKKMKGWDDANYEWHWYEHHGVGKVGLKAAGDPDPF